MNSTANRRYRFGPFEADERTGELRKHGLRLRLPAQPFQILLMLLEQPGELVTRESIRQRLWPDGTFVDFDHSLNSAVNKLRDALGDSAAKPRYIETLSRRGYRFIGQLEDLPSPAPVLVAPVAPPSPVESVPAPTVLTGPEDLPAGRPGLVRTLFVLAQVMYLCFYLSALAQTSELQSILSAWWEPNTAAFWLVITSASIGIAIRLFLLSALAFRVPRFERKFLRLFPLTFALDALWALSPFLLLHHIGFGLSLAATAALLLVPFGERTLVLMMSAQPVAQ
jgi:cholera toxin transcriptional activator